MNSKIKKANVAFRKGLYKKAEALYYKASRENPALQKFIDFNRKLTRKKINAISVDKLSEVSIDMPNLTIGVMCSPHVNFIAVNIIKRLEDHKINARLYNEMPKDYSDNFYIVLTPQVFTKLPPGEKRIVYQLEQHVSSRWFTPEYLNILESSLAMLDYSIENLVFLKSKGIAYPHTFYLPVGTANSLIDKSQTTKDIDILFYGDSLSSERRRKLLSALPSSYVVKIINNVFGSEMHSLIRRSKIVINIHYYKNALLEVPRIMECISLGVPVVSETSSDQKYHNDFEGSVRFFPEGNIDLMLSAIKDVLASPPSIELFQDRITFFKHRFEFMFDRLLIALGLLPLDVVSRLSPPLTISNNLICLSMPETFDRKSRFLKYNLKDLVFFDGLRYRPSWIGCGLSYYLLAHYAVKNNVNRITIIEDDAEIAADFSRKLKIVNSYLDQCQSWDVYCGLIASLHKDVSILNVEVFDGITFVTIDKMTSMVCNIYNSNFMSNLAKWNPELDDVDNNTIDRYIENQVDLKVITTLPYLVGHKEEIFSTLWGFKNNTYTEMIRESERQLREKVLIFLQKEPPHNSGS